MLPDHISMTQMMTPTMSQLGMMGLGGAGEEDLALTSGTGLAFSHRPPDVLHTRFPSRSETSLYPMAPIPRRSRPLPS